MVLLMASRRGGSLLTLDYFLYVFPYVCLITIPLTAVQFFTHHFQHKKGFRINWMLLVAFICAAAQAILGYLIAWAFDF